MSDRREKPHIHVTAGLIWQDGKLLITKRPEGSHLAGLWEFPGGKREDGESLEECLEREISEELGMDIKAGRLLISLNHEYESKEVTLHLFNCQSLKGIPQAIECEEFRWVSHEELKNYTFPPPDKKIIELLNRYLTP